MSKEKTKDDDCENLVESSIRAIATKKLIKQVSHELDKKDPEDAEELLKENEIKDE